MLALSFYHGILAFHFFVSPLLFLHHFHLSLDTLLLLEGLAKFTLYLFLFHLLLEPDLLTFLHLCAKISRLLCLLIVSFLLIELSLFNCFSNWFLKLIRHSFASSINFGLQNRNHGGHFVLLRLMLLFQLLDQCRIVSVI